MVISHTRHDVASRTSILVSDQQHRVDWSIANPAILAEATGQRLSISTVSAFRLVRTDTETDMGGNSTSEHVDQSFMVCRQRPP